MKRQSVRRVGVLDNCTDPATIARFKASLGYPENGHLGGPYPPFPKNYALGPALVRGVEDNRSVAEIQQDTNRILAETAAKQEKINQINARTDKLNQETARLHEETSTIYTVIFVGLGAVGLYTLLTKGWK